MSLRDNRWFRRDLIYFADSGIQGTKSVPVPDGGPSVKLNHCVAFVSEGQASQEKIKHRHRSKTSATCRPVRCVNPGALVLFLLATRKCKASHRQKSCSDKHRDPRLRHRRRITLLWLIATSVATILVCRVSLCQRS